MNEVRSSQIASQLLVSSASSRGAREATSSESSGNVLPGEAEAPERVVQPEADTTSPNELRSAVVNVNDFVQSIQRDIQFSVDEDLEQTVIKVVDSDSGELIRQIPEDVFLELARRLRDDGEFRLLNALG